MPRSPAPTSSPAPNPRELLAPAPLAPATIRAALSAGFCR